MSNGVGAAFLAAIIVVAVSDNSEFITKNLPADVVYQSRSYEQAVPPVQQSSPAVQGRNLPSEPIQRAIAEDTESEDVIKVDLSERTLCYLEQCYPVIVGSPELPTPTGVFRLKLFECTNGCTMLALGFKEGYIPGIGEGFYAIHDVSPRFAETYGCIGTHPSLQAKLLASVTEGTILVIQE